MYGFLIDSHYFLDVGLVILLGFSVWLTLNDSAKRRICSVIKKEYKRRDVVDQLILLISIILFNIFTCSSYGDFWVDTTSLIVAVSLIQLIALILLFIKSRIEDDHIRRTVVIGLSCLLLEFTNMYYFIYLFGDRNNVFKGVVDGSPIARWCDFFFYSISLVIPYSLTEIIPLTFLVKSLSLLQIGLFYLLVFAKVSSVFKRNRVI